MLPSLKTLRQITDDPKTVRFWLENDPTQHPAGAARVAECWHPPALFDVRLTVLDVILETSGVESFDTPDGPCYYLNAGDTYTPTLIYFKRRYRVACWGDIAERYGE